MLPIPLENNLISSLSETVYAANVGIARIFSSSLLALFPRKNTAREYASAGRSSFQCRLREPDQGW